MEQKYPKKEDQKPGAGLARKQDVVKGGGLEPKVDVFKICVKLWGRGEETNVTKGITN